MTLWWLNLAGSSSGFTLGSLCLKRFADTGAWTTLSVSFAIFAVSNLLFAQVLRAGLGQGVVASSMLQIILMAILGFLVFGEKLGRPLGVGVFFHPGFAKGEVFEALDDFSIGIRWIVPAPDLKP